MLGGRFTDLLSLDLLAKCREVLVRPAIHRHHGLTDAEAEVVLTELAPNGTLHAPGPPTKAPPDVHDRHLWALLKDAATAVFVTADRALRRSAPEPTRILSPRQCPGRLSGIAGDAGPSR